jgi:hypothetical protein
MMKVNAMTRNEVDALVAAARREFERRSAMRWTVRVAPEVLRRFPLTAIVDGTTSR